MIIFSEKYYSVLQAHNHHNFNDIIKFNNFYFFRGNAIPINDKYFLLGEVDYIIKEKTGAKVSYSINEFKKLTLDKNTSKITENLEGNFVLIELVDSTISLFLDSFGKTDIFYYSDGKEFIVSDSMSLFYELGLTKYFDEIALSSFFTLYGNYAPKKHTIYKNIFRVGVNEYLKVSKNGIEITFKSYNPVPVSEYDDNNLDQYFNFLWDAIKLRSSKNGINWVYLSSGWDSTAILGFLREMYPAEQVRGVIGEMFYSIRSGTINQFEVDRAKAIAEYYKIKLDIVPLDYTKKNSVLYFQELIPFLKDNLIISFSSLNFSLLSDFINKNSSEEDSIFSGEISDGVHNLGFSQFATILDHPDLDFREYADKMACYMFSPSFIKTILDGNYQKDIVYNFLKNRSSNSIFDNIDGYDKTDLFIKILSSFFIYPKRFPFYSMDNSAILSQKARKEYSETYQKIYLREISEKLSPEKIYSAIIYLYNSFHWQGSTVKVIGKSLERYNKQIKLPFWDISVQNFLSQMPESWGRGLDLKNTKYPLKWVLKNKINYPLHLQKGPHSYLYDVNPGFSHLAETLYGSAMNSFFREILKSGKYKNALDSDYFNLNYIKEIIESFNSGEELSGQKLNDIGSLILLSLII